MSSILESLLYILAILFPLGMTYVILLLQTSNPPSSRRKTPATARDDLLQNMACLSCAKDKHAAP
jgi:hypothetical protein